MSSADSELRQEEANLHHNDVITSRALVSCVFDVIRIRKAEIRDGSSPVPLI